MPNLPKNMDNMVCLICNCEYNYNDFDGNCPCCADDNHECGNIGEYDDLSDLEGGENDEYHTIQRLNEQQKELLLLVRDLTKALYEHVRSRPGDLLKLLERANKVRRELGNEQLPEG